MLYKIRYLLRAILSQTRQKDDFNWNVYSEHYKGELTSSSRKYSIVLKVGDFIFAGNKLLQRAKTLPLNPNHMLLYETVLQLHPSSVIEIGCGGGDHLHNLRILGKGIKEIHGIDISREQLAFLRKRHPHLRRNVEQLDVTLPLPVNHAMYDVAFTQAVLMHIKTGNSHLVALVNIFSFAKKQVALVENWERHNFMKDITLLFKKRIIPWKKLYYYYQESKGREVPPLMIISAIPLKRYPKLIHYSTLLKMTH
jgi:SAM-dependent methyltransferase